MGVVTFWDFFAIHPWWTMALVWSVGGLVMITVTVVSENLVAMAANWNRKS